MKKYFLTESNLNLIFTRKGFNIDSDTIVKNHLINFFEDLKPKKIKDLRGRKPGKYEWFEIQDNIAYYKNFDKEKIVWPLTAANWGFAIDYDKHYLSSGGFMLISENLHLNYILAVLNSSVMKFLFSKIGVMTAGGAFTLKKATIDEFPLKIIDDSTQQAFIKKVNQILAEKSQNPSADTSVLETDIDQLVYALYELTAAEIKIVESAV
jgi:adenine-specific DNA-methyltransferase